MDLTPEELQKLAKLHLVSLDTKPKATQNSAQETANQEQESQSEQPSQVVDDGEAANLTFEPIDDKEERK